MIAVLKSFGNPSKLNDSMPDALFRGLLPRVSVVEACDLSLIRAPVDIQGFPGTILKKREALERMTSKLEELNPHQAFILLKNAFAIPKLQYVLRPLLAYLCREELRVFDRALFDSLEKVAKVSLEGDVCKQAGFPVSFGGLGCRSLGEQEISPCLLGVPVVELPCLMTRDVRRSGTFLLLRKIGICCWRQIRCLEPD